MSVAIRPLPFYRNFSPLRPDRSNSAPLRRPEQTFSDRTGPCNILFLLLRPTSCLGTSALSHGRGQWFKPTIAHHIKQGLSALFRHVPNAGYTFGYTFSAFSLAGTLWYSLPSLVTHNAEPWQHTNLSKAERHPGAHLFGLLDFPQRHARLRPRRRPRPGPNRSNCDCSHRNAPARWHPTDSWSAALSSCERPPRSASFWIMHAQRTSESVIPSR